jgi:pyridoxal/pyridoxine/pyridoxamine kinase
VVGQVAGIITPNQFGLGFLTGTEPATRRWRSNAPRRASST